jgi:toxin ParE1/3/4
MKVVFAPRAVRDLERIGAYYRSVASEKVAGAAAERLRHVINLIALRPEIAPRIERPSVRVALVLRYPYKIFYRVQADAVEILHIRHTARRPWIGED